MTWMMLYLEKKRFRGFWYKEFPSILDLVEFLFCFVFVYNSISLTGFHKILPKEISLSRYTLTFMLSIDFAEEKSDTMIAERRNTRKGSLFLKLQALRHRPYTAHGVSQLWCFLPYDTFLFL